MASRGLILGRLEMVLNALWQDRLKSNGGKVHKFPLWLKALVVLLYLYHGTKLMSERYAVYRVSFDQSGLSNNSMKYYLMFMTA
jgi:hypothetical protein